jgi:serine/threonine protein kinase
MPAQKTLNRKASAAKRARRAGEEILPGYRLIEPIGRGGFGEVWKCEAPGGLHKAAKFVHRALDHLHGSSACADEELSAIQRVKAIRHPFLLSIERVESAGDHLIVVSELADKSLHALFQEYRQAGKQGIPREQLLHYLWEAAEALDVLNLRHSLLHLDVKPQNLFLVSEHVKLGDFGLVYSLDTETRNGDKAAMRDSVTPRYAAPELFQGAVSQSSDQYSLAIVYQELLTGILPFDGTNARQLMVQHAQAEPELAALPLPDRAAVARALSKDPARRFPSCAAFAQALAESWCSDEKRSLVHLAREGAASLDGSGLASTFRSHLTRDLLRQRLDGFRRRWQGQILQANDRDLVFRIKTPRGFWQRWLGRRPGLEIHIQMTDAADGSGGGLNVTVIVRPHELGKTEGLETLEVIGLLLVEGLRDHLQVTPRRRGQERLLWPYQFDARPVFGSGRVVGQPIRCLGKDISMSGIGFLAPRELATPQLHVTLPLTPHTPAVEVAARVVRSRKLDDGWWEVGALLLAPVGSEKP